VIPYQWTSAIIAIVLAGTIILLVRRDHLSPRNATWWIVAAMVVAVVGVTPGLVDFIAAGLGVHYPPILAVLLAMALLLVKLLRTDIALSKEQQKLRILAQKMALLEAELKREREQRNVEPNLIRKPSQQSSP